MKGGFFFAKPTTSSTPSTSSTASTGNDALMAVKQAQSIGKNLSSVVGKDLTKLSNSLQKDASHISSTVKALKADASTVTKDGTNLNNILSKSLMPALQTAKLHSNTSTQKGGSRRRQAGGALQLGILNGASAQNTQVSSPTLSGGAVAVTETVSPVVWGTLNAPNALTDNSQSATAVAGSAANQAAIKSMGQQLALQAQAAQQQLAYQQSLQQASQAAAAAAAARQSAVASSFPPMTYGGPNTITVGQQGGSSKKYRKFRGGYIAPVGYSNPDPMNLSLQQGQGYLKYHEAQHGGSVATLGLNPYPGSVEAGSFSKDIALDSARQTGLIHSYDEIKGMTDMAGGRRANRKSKKQRKSRNSRNTRKNRKSRKNRKNRTNRKNRKQRGGDFVRWGGGYGGGGSRRRHTGGSMQDVYHPSSVKESTHMLISPQMQAQTGLNHEWANFEQTPNWLDPVGTLPKVPSY